MQNSPDGIFIPGSSRHAFFEYPAVINGTFGHNLRMRLPVEKVNKDDERVWRTNATTLRRLVRNAPLRTTPFTPMTMAENPSIEVAFEKADIVLQQLANTLLPSTLAILFLPLILSLIPISCFSYVSTTYMLGYTLLTDVITTTPLAIKGIELLYIQRRRFRSVVVRISSNFNNNGELPGSAASETWASECRTEDEVGRIGAIFLGIALFALVLGIFLELVVFHYVRRRRKLMHSLHKTDNHDWLGSSAGRKTDTFLLEEYELEYDMRDKS